MTEPKFDPFINQFESMESEKNDSIPNLKIRKDSYDADMNQSIASSFNINKQHSKRHLTLKTLYNMHKMSKTFTNLPKLTQPQKFRKKMTTKFSKIKDQINYSHNEMNYFSTTAGQDLIEIKNQFK